MYKSRIHIISYPDKVYVEEEYNKFAGALATENIMEVKFSTVAFEGDLYYTVYIRYLV